jgi:hypothetical protein
MGKLVGIFDHLNPITPLTKAETLAEEAAAKTEGYVHRDLVACDIAANVIAGGHEDETISSRCSRDALQHKPVGVAVSEVLDVFQSNHGAKAQASDVERAKELIALEDSAGDLNQ